MAAGGDGAPPSSPRTGRPDGAGARVGAAAGVREGAAPVPYGNGPRSSVVPEGRHGVTQTIDPTGWSLPVDVAVKPKVALPSGGRVRL